jgi:transposase
MIHNPELLEDIMRNLYWLAEAQMQRLRPYFPKSRGGARVNDLRVPSGSIFINRNGVYDVSRYERAAPRLRWCDVHVAYGPPKTLYNRWKRWRDMGVFARLMMGLAEQAPGNKTILRLLQNPKVLVGYNAEVV